VAEIRTPHFHNTGGYRVIRVGVREFMCIGAAPPYDHPHIFLDMGGDDEIVCSYCSTLYRYSSDVPAGVADPADCVWSAEPAVAI
jgi:uncharacterized Zn-finger protein